MSAARRALERASGGFVFGGLRVSLDKLESFSGQFEMGFHFLC